MAWRFNGTTSQWLSLGSDAATRPAATNFCAMFMVRIEAIELVPQAFFAGEQNSPFEYVDISLSPNTLQPRVWAGPTYQNLGSLLVLGDWYFFAFRQNGSGANTVKAFRIDPDGTLTTQDRTGIALTGFSTSFRIGNNEWNEPVNGDMACFKLTTGAITDAEIINESRSMRLQATDKRFAFFPAYDSAAAASYVDMSGNGNGLTAVGGDVTMVGGPPISWGASPIIYPRMAAPRRRRMLMMGVG